jgi:hypothetical protein
MSKTAPDTLDAALKGTKARVVGEVHVRQVSRKIERNPSDAAFLKLLAVAARHGAAVVIHDELTAGPTEALEKALAAERKAIIVLAHAGEATPGGLEAVLTRNPNLMVDLSGMHRGQSARRRHGVRRARAGGAPSSGPRGDRVRP